MGQDERVRAWMGIGSAVGAILVLLAIAVAVVPGRAVDRAVDGGAPEHTHAAARGASGYAESVARVHDLAGQLEVALAGAKVGQSERAAQIAYELGESARGVGRVALTDEAVPRDQVKAANLAGKA